MAADVKFRLVVDDSVAPSPHTLTPSVLYRGMAVTQEYVELYAVNEGTTLSNPAYSLVQLTGAGSANLWPNASNRKIVRHDTSEVMIAYSTANGGDGPSWNYYPSTLLGPTAVPDTDLIMPNGRRYDIYTKHRVGRTDTALGTYRWRHVIGGTD